MCHSRCCLVTGALITVVAVTLLTSLLSEVLPRFLFSDGLTSSSCTVTGQVFYGNVCCVETQQNPDIWDLGNCIGITYPCYGVSVTYDLADSTSQTGNLFESYTDQKYQGSNITCSKYTCPSRTTYDSALDDVNSFLTAHSSGSTSDCWYDTDSVTKAFASVPVSSSQFVHATVWSSLLCLIGIIVMILAVVLADKIDKEDEPYSESHNAILVKGGDMNPEVRTEELYGYQNRGAMVEIDSDRPTTAAAKGLMVKSNDTDGNSLFVPSASKC